VLFLIELGFEFRASCLQSRHSTSWATPPVHIVPFYIKVLGIHRFWYLWGIQEPILTMLSIYCRFCAPKLNVNSPGAKVQFCSLFQFSPRQGAESIFVECVNKWIIIVCRKTTQILHRLISNNCIWSKTLENKGLGHLDMSIWRIFSCVGKLPCQNKDDRPSSGLLS
jgi:hypothetical protein